MALFGRRNQRTRDRQLRFERLLTPVLPTLYRVAYRYTGRREDAEDLVQELLTRLYPRLDELERLETLRPWLMKALYNAFVDGVRWRSRRPDANGEGLPIDTLAAATDSLRRLEDQQHLQRALDELTPEHRAVVMLHLVEGYSLPELSLWLDVELGTLKSRLHRARARLRASLADGDDHG